MNPRTKPILFELHPALESRVPWTALGAFPTPVEPMEKLGASIGAPRLFVKRDDRSGETYGGNKVRKLEFSLADVKARGRGPVITMGAVGSNHVLATTIYAGKLGLEVVGIMIPQPVQENLRTNILCNCVAGCRIESVNGMGGALGRIIRIYLGDWMKNRRRPYLLWAGGSSVLGVLGYVEGALELAAQVREGLLPEPDYVFTPVGSAGTLAGLVLGLKLAGLKTRAVGVRVFDRSGANERITAFMANRALKYLRRLDPAIPDHHTDPAEVLMLHDYFGPGYAVYTAKAVAAMAQAQELEGMKLEGTYSGKCLAGMMDFMTGPEHRDQSAVFINTYNSRPLEPLLASCPGPEILPEPIREYFEKDIEPVAR